MTSAPAIADEELEDLFDASEFDLNIPQLDGHRAVHLDLRFSGSAALDRTSDDDLALLEAARLGEPVRLIVVGEVGGKGFRLTRTKDGEAELLLQLYRARALGRSGRARRDVGPRRTFCPNLCPTDVT